MKYPFVLLSILSLTSCNTMRGFGEDVGLAGHTLATTSDRVAGKSEHRETTASTMPSAPIDLRDRETIKQVQGMLRDQQLYDGRIDGIAGIKTHTALSDYQREKGLPVSGEIDEATMNSLYGRTAPNSNNNPQPAQNPNQPNP